MSTLPHRDDVRRPCIMVLGAGGFLGGAIARAMAPDAHVLAVGRHLEALASAPVECFGMSLPDPRLDELIARYRPDWCVHAAAPASVRASLQAPGADLSHTLLPWSSVLEALRRSSPETRTLLVSSAAVYGNPARLPVAEDGPVAPVSPYGYHRWYCELMQEQYRALHGLQGVSLRIFSAYGPGLRRQVVWDLCEKALTAPAIVLEGTGEESRDFVHVDDVVDAVRRILSQVAPQAVYNLGSGRETSIAELARTVVSLLGQPREIRFTGHGTQGMPGRWHADIRRLRSLGFEPSMTLEKGVRDVMYECQAWRMRR